MKQVVLVFLRREQQVLLGIKKTGFGQGKYVAVGGHIEAGETPEQAAKREFFEETSAQVSNLQLKARVRFEFPAKPEWNMHAHVFESFEWHGDLLESAEIAPAWFEMTALPLAQMWDDGGYWVRQMLSGECFDARMVYCSDNQTVQNAHLEPWLHDVTMCDKTKRQNNVTNFKNGLQ
jgi:8-oxo-dGTP diphosphatase